MAKKSTKTTRALQADLDALAGMHLSDQRRIALLEDRVQLLEEILERLLRERRQGPGQQRAAALHLPIDPGGKH